MKTLTTYLEIVFEMFKPLPSFDRVSLEGLKFAAPEEPEKKQETELITMIPQDYLYSRLHEIEDDTWNYVVNIHPSTMNSDLSNDR